MKDETRKTIKRNARRMDAWSLRLAMLDARKSAAEWKNAERHEFFAEKAWILTDSLRARGLPVE